VVIAAFGDFNVSVPGWGGFDAGSVCVEEGDAVETAVEALTLYPSPRGRGLG